MAMAMAMAKLMLLPPVYVHICIWCAMHTIFFSMNLFFIFHSLWKNGKKDVQNFGKKRICE